MERKACTFFGHRYATVEVVPPLREVLTDLVENKGVTVFYIGIQGMFDVAAHRVVRELKRQYPHLQCFLVSSSVYAKKSKTQESSFEEERLVPEGVETVPKRFAIAWCNRWMVDRSDYVVTYVTHSWGGAATYKAYAERKKKIVINIEL